MAKQVDEDASKPWMIRDVPDHVRVDVKTYAVQHKMTVAEALTELIGIALGKVQKSSFVLSMNNPDELKTVLRQMMQELQTGANSDKDQS